jgi:predicted nucleic acid-binding protein
VSQLIYVLDTDILTDLEYRRANVVRRFTECLHLGRVATTDVNILERLRGWQLKIQQTKSRVELARYYQFLGKAAKFLSLFDVLHVTESCLEQATLLRDKVKKLKLRGEEKPGDRDLLMACIVIEHSDTILVTHNIRHFVEILPETRLIDWPK